MCGFYGHYVYTGQKKRVRLLERSTPPWLSDHEVVFAISLIMSPPPADGIAGPGVDAAADDDDLAPEVDDPSSSGWAHNTQ